MTILQKGKMYKFPREMVVLENNFWHECNAGIEDSVTLQKEVLFMYLGRYELSIHARLNKHWMHQILVADKTFWLCSTHHVEAEQIC